MPQFDPADLSARFRESFRRVDVPSPFDTAIAVVNPDGTTISGGGGGGTVNQGTPNNDANAWPVRITDGTHDMLVTAAGAAKVDGSAVTQPISAASLPLPTGAATEATLATRANQATVASILANQTNGTQVVTGSGNFTVVQPSGASLHVDVDNFPATQPISGTVTANIGTTGGLALDATLTNGSQHTIVDSGSITVNNTSGAGAVNIQDGGNSITVDGTITANAGSGNFTVVQSTGSNLHAVLDSGSTTTVTQATGTNLHTVIDSGTISLPSNAAQETGGNLATINTNTRIPTSVTSFQATLTGAEAALASNASKSIAIKAPSTNTDNVFIGTTGVTTSTGYMLSPGDAVSMDVTNSNLVHAIVGSGTQTLTVLVNN